MKTNDIDDLIKKALTKEEAEFYDQLDEESIPEMITGLYSGKMKWLSAMMTFGMLIVFVLAVICLVQFFRQDDIATMIQWGIGAVIFMNAVGMIKLMQFMQIDRNAIIREIKRLEWQIAVLAGKISHKG